MRPARGVSWHRRGRGARPAVEGLAEKWEGEAAYLLGRLFATHGDERGGETAGEERGKGEDTMNKKNRIKCL